jgi:GNAT superfamily N-acetyltransferase
MGPVIFAQMRDEDAKAVSRLVTLVFDAAVAPLYEPEGVEAFHDYASPEAILERSRGNHFVIMAVEGTNLLGVAEVRDNCHLSMLFVLEGYQGAGLGGALVDRAIATCLAADPNVASMTVNASPNSIGAYERYGFAAMGPEQTVNGIRFTPMSISIALEEPSEFEFDLDD